MGGVYVRDEDPGKSFGMRAVTGEYKFGERTTLSAELASTRNGDSSLLDSQLTGSPAARARRRPPRPAPTCWPSTLAAPAAWSSAMKARI